jgi:hypothetical protein
MEFLDFVFFGIGSFVIKLGNRIFDTKFSLGDGGLVVTAFIFKALLAVLLLVQSFFFFTSILRG